MKINSEGSGTSSTKGSDRPRTTSHDAFMGFLFVGSNWTTLGGGLVCDYVPDPRDQRPQDVTWRSPIPGGRTKNASLKERVS
jgi:hypothetical protein